MMKHLRHQILSLIKHKETYNQVYDFFSKLESDATKEITMEPTMTITERDACIFASLIPKLKKTAKKMAEAERQLGHIAGANEFEDYVEDLDKRLKEAANTPEFKAKFEERMKRVKGKE